MPGVGRDHEMRRSADRDEGSTADVGRDQVIGALHGRMTGSAAHDQGRNLHGSEGRCDSAKPKALAQSSMLTGVVSTASALTRGGHEA